MGSLRLSDAFKASYNDLDSYPLNIISQATYRGFLRAYTERLAAASSKLFASDNGKIYVPFRDLLPVHKGFERLEATDDQSLKSRLGDQSMTDVTTGHTTGAIATKCDPRCRFIFLQADNAREPLNLTKRMFVRIMSYHQVMPQYLDLVALFGSRIRDRDRRFSSFRDYTTLQNAPKGTSMQDLARSGRQFQLCYNLKAINCISDENTSPELKQWSVRQGAFLHQFDVELGTTLWIVTKGKPDPREGRQDIKEQIEELTGPKGRKQDRSFKSAAQSFRSSLSVHLLFCYWAMLDWRWYIQCLEEKVENKTDSIVQELRSNKNSRQTYASEDLMTIQGFEDDINEAIMIMESNNDTLSSLQAYYEKLLKHKHFPSELLTECLDDVQLFATQISGMIHDAKMHISRARLLLKIADDRKTILIQHLQSQTTEKMESLNQGMFGIGVQSQKDTVAMRIVTFVTLIYLPATFVSTFFSTDVVKYQPPDNSPVVTNATFSTPAFQGSYSSIALNRWLQVTLPLTMITLMAAVLWYRIDSGKRQKIWIQIAKGENRENLLPLYTTVKEK